MSNKKPERDIQTRRQLFDFLQGQMQVTYTDLKENQRYLHESSLIKSYIIEVNTPTVWNGNSNEWLAGETVPWKNLCLFYSL